MAKQKTTRVPRSRQRLEQQGPALGAHAVRTRSATPRSKSWLGSLFLLGVSVLFLVQFLADARFRVAQVTIDGVTLVPTEEVRAAAALEGRQLFAIQTRQVEAQLLALFECLGRVRVQTRLPDRVHIQVTEKDALLLWESQGVYWWVDAEGRVLGRAASRGDLPSVHDRSELGMEPGQHIVGVPWAFAVEMSRAMPDARDFEFTVEDGLILIAPEGWPVYLGYGGNAAQKAILLEQLTEVLVARGGRVIYVDLKNELRPIAKIDAG